jgi:hypothetical protein
MAAQPSAPDGGISQLPALEQVSHVPVQPAWQQRFCRQLFELHWPLAVHAVPISRGIA